MDLALSVDSRMDPGGWSPSSSLRTAWSDKTGAGFDPNPGPADETYSKALERYATVEIITEIVDELIVEKTLTESETDEKDS